MNPPAAGRVRAQRRGRFAEHLAAWRLRLAGYRILARGYRTPVGEIDLIVRRGGVVAFVEVKARPDLASAAEAVGGAQRTRIARAAMAFLAARAELRNAALRFDVVLVAPWRLPRHIADAWRDSG
ncbi:MAG: YraN family protein [Rhodospirillales bacterium]|nr:YraN family protein [Rhodospirillales bacterium]